ncbi:hypothetical protein AAKU55_002190 [Oxalobacteraceae bacterium GrIS 1.11]
MNSNPKGGSKGRDNNKQSGPDGSRSGTQGGTHEQHVDAGRQSHKNDQKSGGASGNKQSDTKR